MPIMAHVPTPRNDQAGEKGRKAMTVFYRSPLVLITHEVFVASYPFRQRFLIRELRDVREFRGRPDRLVIGSTVGTGVTTATAAACWPLLHTPVDWLIAIMAVALSGAFGGACWRMSPPELQLIGTYHGYGVRLFVSRDARVFGQVKRALMCAREANECW
jgi:hypothetical protein